jgi:hypothetical protein
VVGDGFTTDVFAGARLPKIKSRDSFDPDGIMEGGCQCDEELMVDTIWRWHHLLGVYDDVKED